MSFSDKTGPVTPKEAHEILIRFCNSHFNNPHKEKARATIPADPQRDDDIRMSAFIDQSEASMKEIATLRAQLQKAEELLKEFQKYTQNKNTVMSLAEGEFMRNKVDAYFAEKGKQPSRIT